MKVNRLMALVTGSKTDEGR